MPRFSDILMEYTAKGIEEMGRVRSRSFAWFADRARHIRAGIRFQPGNRVYTENVIRQHPVNTDLQFKIGSMVLYKYDPKYKLTLPYYDIYPLIFPIELYENGFLGINMHYLPLLYRANLMDALYYTLEEQSEFNEQDVLRISYDILNSAAQFSYFRPCVKRYLSDHIRSNIVVLPLVEWEAALFLPLASWAKQNEDTVWRDSLDIIRRS